MFLKGIYFVVCVVLGVGNSAFVDILKKCPNENDKCITDLAQNVIQNISTVGIPDMGIPALDPLILKDLTIPMLGLLNVSLNEVQIKGIKDCAINSMKNDIRNGVLSMDLTCDINIKGKFKLDGVSPLIENILGRNAIRADGTTKIKVDKLNLNMKIFYDVIRKDDGDIYFSCHIDQFVYNFDIGNIRMNANKIYFGNQDISDFVVTFVNQNWKFLISTFGKGMFDIAMDIFNNILHSFFQQLPAKYVLIDDLSAFVKN